MLTQAQLQEIKEHLEKAKNPLFLFDDDHDGLASYLLFQRKYPRGHGVCIKAALHNESIYVKKITFYKPDRVFFLDRAIISQELLDTINVPVIWIDHHQPVPRRNVNYYNPMHPDRKDNRPTSHWCYQVVQQDRWIAAVGIIGDWHVPEFYDDFEYKELFNKKRTVEELLYESDIGVLVKIFNFVLKYRTSEVKKCIKLLLKIESPYEILKQETPRGRYIYRRFEEVDKLYQKLLARALKSTNDDELFVFKYPSAKLSFTGDIANELLCRLKEKKMIIIAREKNDEVRLSLRSNKVKVLNALQRALEGVEGHGGGHEHACGAHVHRSDFEKFLENLRREIAQS